LLAALPVAVSVVACAQLPRAAIVDVPLTASRINAGETGRATLVAVDGRAQVQVWVSGVPPQLVSRPVHLYTFVYAGSCAGLPTQPAFSLTENVLARSPASSAIAPLGGPFTITNSAPVSLEELRTGHYALLVTTAPADGNHELFCGNIR
jgi:hypothetical protein